MNSNLTRQERRLAWKRWRDDLPSTFRESAQAALAANLDQALHTWLTRRLAMGLTQKPIIAVFWPIQSEPDLRGLWQQWLGRSAQLQLALPVVKGKGQPLAFSAWHDGEALSDDAYNTKVPSRFDPVTPDLLLAPCVAFCQTGEGVLRLGYGGGYYDRSLAVLKQSKPLVSAWAIAYAGSSDEVLSAQATDILFEALITEA